MATLLAGRTVVGGVVGGILGVILARRLVGLKKPMGNHFAPAIALGYAIGRIGCLCQGCCYGNPTHGHWGIDMGDHVLRWPTQALESLFGFCLFIYLMIALRRNPAPGALFREFMLLFFGFRFLIEFVRHSGPFVLGISQAQVVSLALIFIYGGTWIVQKRKLMHQSATIG